jgi:hypothetical protein
MMPGASRRRAITSSGTSIVGAMSMTAVPGVGGTAHVHVGDVDAGVAEQGADGADHTGAVVVLHDEHVLGGRHVEVVVVDHHDALLAARPDQRARDAVPAAAQGDQVDEVGGGGAVRLAQLDALLLGQLRRVHVGDRLVADGSRRSPSARPGVRMRVSYRRCRPRSTPRASGASGSARQRREQPAERSASGRNGRSVSLASAASTLTANGTKSPARASCTMSAIVSPALSCASRVLAPRCGVTTT